MLFFYFYVSLSLHLNIYALHYSAEKTVKSGRTCLFFHQLHFCTGALHQAFLSSPFPQAHYCSVLICTHFLLCPSHCLLIATHSHLPVAPKPRSKASQYYRVGELYLIYLVMQRPIQWQWNVEWLYQCTVPHISLLGELKVQSHRVRGLPQAHF